MLEERTKEERKCLFEYLFEYLFESLFQLTQPIYPFLFDIHEANLNTNTRYVSGVGVCVLSCEQFGAVLLG